MSSLSNEGSWQVELLRVTAFPVEPATSVPRTWWEDVRGAEPDSRISQPKIRKHVDRGAYERGELVLGYNPDRIDWLYKLPEDRILSEFVSLGEYSDSTRQLAQITKAWLKLDNLPRIKRIAFGARLMWPVEDHVEANKILAQFLPNLRFDPLTARDVMLRINRPTSSASVEGLELNRLATWSIQHLVSLFGGVDGLSMQVPGRAACSLELDISSPANLGDALGPDKLADLLIELMHLGKTLAQQGDTG